MALSLLEFAERRGPTWDRLDDTLGHARARDPEHGVARVRWLGAVHRQVVADLAYARRRFPGDPVTMRLERLVAASRAAVYADARERSSVTAFLTRGFWRRIMERPVFVIVAAAMLIVPMAVLGFWAHGSPDAASRVAGVTPMTAAVGDGQIRDPETDRITELDANAAFSTAIFTNNVRVAFAAFAGGLTAGVLTLVSLAFNGFQVGLVSGLAVRAGDGEALVRLIVPHGLLELSLIVVAGAAGLRVGWALLRPGHRSRLDALVEEGRAGVEMALGAGLLLVPCGLIEGFVTPRGLGLAPATAFGVGLAVLFWVTVVMRGRASAPGTLRAAPAP